MSIKFELKKKRAKAIWTQAYPAQHKKLYPENTARGGVKAQSGSKKMRDAIYSEIAKLFKAAFPYCEACKAIRHCNAAHARPTEDVHHKRGKVGLLYFDVRHWISVCRACHTWIGDNIEAARAIGLLCERGDWNREDE